MCDNANSEYFSGLTIMFRYSRGILYCALLYGSTIAGFLFIACPLLPLLLFSPPKFRKYAEFSFSCWELYLTALLNMFGVKIYVSGDHISPHESAVLVMNHRTRVDWNFLWAAMYQAYMPSIVSHKLKFVSKDSLRHIPGPGWIGQMNGFLFITRRWEEDQDRLSRSLDYLITLGSRTQLLIFPEGTNLTKNTKEKSDKYALQHHLPQYTYTLHPKTTGFAYLVQHFQRANYLDAVYDLTIAYPDYIPQSEIDLIKGKLPEEIHFHIKRIPTAEIPTHESTLRKWLENKWSDKEGILKQFYEQKTFSSTEIWPMAKILPLRAAFGFWNILIGITILLLIISPIFQLWALIHTAFFVGLSVFNTGFNQIEMGWYSRWKNHPFQAKRKILRMPHTTSSTYD